MEKLTTQQIEEILEELSNGGHWAMKHLQENGPIAIGDVDGRFFRSPERMGLVEVKIGAWYFTELGAAIMAACE